jgi:hypothetical protein
VWPRCGRDGDGDTASISMILGGTLQVPIGVRVRYMTRTTGPDADADADALGKGQTRMHMIPSRRVGVI